MINDEITHHRIWHSPITCSRLTVNRSAYMFTSCTPSRFSNYSSSTIFSGERNRTDWP